MIAKKLKARRSRNTIYISATKEICTPLPPYFFIDLDLSTVKARKKSQPYNSSALAVRNLIKKSSKG